MKTLPIKILRAVARIRALRLALCWAFGHRVDFYESGYEVCGRCGKHAYHDSETWDNAGNLRLDQWLKNRAYERKRRIEFKKAMDAIDRGDTPF